MDEYFHSTQKGCVLIPDQEDVAVMQKGKARILFFQYCETHDAKVCRCGWQFKHHPLE